MLGPAHLLDTVLHDRLSKEDQADLHPPDRRNLPSIFLRALKGPEHRSSNQGDMAGNPPERGKERQRGTERNEELDREKERLQQIKRESASLLY